MNANVIFMGILLQFQKHSSNDSCSLKQKKAAGIPAVLMAFHRFQLFRPHIVVFCLSPVLNPESFKYYRIGADLNNAFFLCLMRYELISLIQEYCG